MNIMKLIRRDGFFDDWFKTPFTGLVSKNHYLQTNLKTKDDKFVFEVEVPGLDKEDIKLSIEDGYLTIDVEKKGSKEAKGKYVRKESYYGRMRRSIYVSDIDEKDVKAKCKKGILNIKITREESKKEEKYYIDIN